ncbi:MAG: hypothetical protein GY769_13675 [bacterium]|nr:hypothetical protein [bacterium]
MTHPFHPYSGRDFALVEILSSGTGSRERVYFDDPDGRRTYIPIDCTDLASVDPFVAAAGGRAYFRAQDLLRLCALVDSLLGDATSDDSGLKW